MFLYYNINRCVQKSLQVFCRLKTAKSRIYIFCFLCFFIHIYVICHSDKSSMTVIFRFSEIIIFSSFIFFIFTHHCTSVNRKVICKVGKRERKIKGVFSFFGFNVFKKSQKLAPQRLLTENVCVSKTFFMRFFDVCTYNRWCLLQCFSQQAVNFEYFTKSILQFVLALR